VATTSIGDWILTVTGTVARIRREDYDKSGRNPRYNLYFVLDVDQAEVPPGASLPAEVAIRVREHDLARLIDRAPVVGDRIIITARANGPRPQSFLMQSVGSLSGGTTPPDR